MGGEKYGDETEKGWKLGDGMVERKRNEFQITSKRLLGIFHRIYSYMKG